MAVAGGRGQETGGGQPHLPTGGQPLPPIRGQPHLPTGGRHLSTGMTHTYKSIPF
jgi:hypothetical protein